ncbi:hypothetical protein LPJ60_003422 [Coemansia sp. RSA 2675]|nr:hypothetical protein LPJ60_003422 [Coemansia sp. RSA 2675]
MAGMWAAELPAIATDCCHGTTITGDGLVLTREGSVHLLLHLLDLAYRYGDIDCGTALTGVCECARVLVKAGECGQLWTALVEFGGVLVSRRDYLGAAERGLALRLAHLAVSVVHLVALDAQVAILALIYTLRTSHGCDVDEVVGGLVRACASISSSTHGVLKEETGQMVLALYGPDYCLPAGLARHVYALQSDFSESVRLMWSRAASCMDSSALRPERHEFAALNHALHCGEYRASSSSLGAGVKEQDLSVSDAMLLVKVVCDSAGGALVADLGLSATALSVILAVSVAMGHRHRAPTAVFDVVDWVVGAAATKLCTLALPERQLVSAHLMDVVRTQMTDAPGQASGLYWVLGLSWQLCLLGGGLLAELDNQLLLLKAAVASSNIAFAVFVVQAAMRHQVPDGSGALQRLAGAVPWDLVDGMLGREAGDAVDYLLRLRTDEVADVQEALYGIQLGDVDTGSRARLSSFDEDVGLPQETLVELESVIRAAENRALAAYVERHAGGLGLADHLLGRVVCRTLSLMPLSVSWASFGGVARQVSAIDVVAETVEFATASGALSHRRAVSLLLAAEGEDLGAKCMQRHWGLYVANRIAAAFMEPEPVATPADVVAAQLFADRVVQAGVTVNDRMEICFAQRLPTTHSDPVRMEPLTAAFIGDILDRSSFFAPDAAKAREALLYSIPWNGPSCGATDALYTQLLMEGSGRIRFTASGTFDPAARLISHMSSYPLSAPTLDTDSLTTNAVEQLAPYIPQLFAMLCYNGSAGDSALAILELLAASAPDLVVFHGVVASRSLPASSMGGGRAQRLLRLFDAQMVADVGAFLDFSKSIAAPPQERLRWVCMKAKSAYDKAMAAYQQGRFAGSAERMAAAFSLPLRPAVKMLREAVAGGAAQSQAEFEFSAGEPALMRMFVWLENRGDHFAGEADVARLAEDIWAVIFKVIETGSAMSVAYFCPRFVEFTANVPIPVLTDPTRPLYFEGVGESLRVIRSKNSPKLLSFSLREAGGSVVVKKYILKGNEDLRIDECVIQTLVRLNRVGSARLAVYNVVPVSAYGGLIEVVEGAPSLAHIYDQLVGRPESFQKTYLSHAQPVLKAAGIAAGEPISKWPADVAGRVYESLLAQSPVDLLYRYVAKRAASPAALLMALRTMVKSIGMASVAGYILGLGDRHLGNILVSDKGLVNIDFNVCFDFGGSSNIPEQVPFRMSPILEYLCGSPNDSQPRPAALSRVFEGAAVATLLFARMDRHLLVALARSAQFRPFMEWTALEESWLRDPTIGDREAAPLEAVEPQDFVRATGLCPPRAFWPRAGESPEVLTDAPSGWRIAQGAVARVRARLDYRGSGERRSEAQVAAEQFRIAWGAATSRDRLSRMYMGWAPWV